MRRLSTEQDEPLPLLADFAASIVHAAHLPEARKYLPLSQEDETELPERFHAAGILAIHQADFNIDCREVFGDLAEAQTEREERSTCWLPLFLAQGKKVLLQSGRASL